MGAAVEESIGEWIPSHNQNKQTFDVYVFVLKMGLMESRSYQLRQLMDQEGRLCRFKLGQK
jgi:hypothetical protein